MRELPSGWAKATIGDLCDVVQGQSPPGSSYNVTADGLPFFQGKAEFGDLRPTVRKWTTDAKKIADAGDVLLSIRAPVGPTNLAPSPCAIGRGLVAIRPRGGISRRFVLYALRSSANELAAQATGSTFAAVSGQQVHSHPLPLAPLAEQRRIVAAIEEQFSRLDAAAGSVESALRRIAALKLAAFSKLNALPLDRKVADVADVRGGIQKQPKRRPIANSYPFLRVANVLRGRLNLDDVHEVELFDGELGRYRLRVGDLLVVEGNGSREQIGRSAVWSGEIENCVHQNHLIRVRPGSELNPRYLGLYWNAPGCAERLAQVASTTSGLYTLSVSKLNALSIAVPPLEDQRRIVAELEQQLSLIDSLRAAVESAQKRSAALRRSILERAFRGELVPQDPADEPASVLLERIRAERAAVPPRTSGAVRSSR